MSADTHDNEHRHEHDQEQDARPDVLLADLTRRTKLDLAAVRAKLASKRGKHYWRTLEEVAEDPAFAEFMHREFPKHASEWEDSVDRRNFLKLAAASLAFAGMTGCARQPEQKVIPYVKQPDGLVLGNPLFFATAMPFGADALGLLVENHEGRPTKIEGNPDHPSSLGGTSAFAQAAILDLYDPDRAQVVTSLGEIRSWAQFLDFAATTSAALKAANGAGLRILSGTVASPSIAAEIEALLKMFPQAKWHRWEPAVSDGACDGAKLAFGRFVSSVYRIDQAEVILALDSDFMGHGPGHVRYQKDFFRRRNLTGSNREMNRLYAVEPVPTVTGSVADNRLPLKAAEVEQFASALAAKLGLGGRGTAPAGSEAFLEAVVKELEAHRGKSLVVAGEQQSPTVHLLAHAINGALGNAGATVYYIEPVEANPGNQLDSFAGLCADMDAGKVNTLIIFGVNPVYTAPHDFDFVRKIGKVENSIHVSSHFDETAEHTTWHVAESHFLETWGDAKAYDGTLSIVQPLIAPLYRTHSAREVLAAFSDKPGVNDYEALRESLKSRAGGDFEKFWRKTLNDGFVANSASPALSGLSAKANLAGLPAVPSASGNQLEFLFRPDPTIYDGRFANNGWLQELPKPITKLTWDNVASVGPKTAEALNVNQEVSARGGEHGRVFSDQADIFLGNSKVTAAVWTLPGQAEGTVLLPLGYGRTRAGFVGSNTGFNAYAVRVSSALWTATAASSSIKKTGDDYPLACTQYHFNMEGRMIMVSGTLDEFKKNPEFVRQEDEQPPRDVTLYERRGQPPQFDYSKVQAWSMAIDLTKCNGCSACVVACQSENNIPVVGKEQVLRGREMHWLRIDRYYLAETETNDPRTHYDPKSKQDALGNPPTFFQPVPCMQCENAPCEQVCPVGATVHSAEGLNDMVYNRCIGTRYCSNNCPYKVRRFNFLRVQDWETPSLKLARNPEVTVRSRGVMEKCTYCVQRINNAKIKAERQNRRVLDGEATPACAQACPSEAIVFGDKNDPNSRVHKLKAQERSYAVLGELNSRPRTTYLAAIRNPNPELEKA
jgi:MoCo/4Fe-4S cofactor protein with predicted Tat translocation signal